MPQYNNSIESAGRILALFTLARPRWGVSEASRELGISKTTAYNILATLEKIDFLVKNVESQKYELGKRIASLAATMAANSELNQKGAGLLQELSSSFGLSTRMGIWDSDAVIIIFAGFPLTVPQHPSFQAGPRVVAYCSAIGRAILAHMGRDVVIDYLNRTRLVKLTPKTRIDRTEIIKELDETRQRGYAICDEEMVYGSAAVGVPIFDRNGRVAGAMSLAGSRDEILGNRMESLIGGLSVKAMQISQSLGATS